MLTLLFAQLEQMLEQWVKLHNETMSWQEDPCSV